MVAEFYDTLLADEAARQFLSHSAVHDRLSASLLGWLTDLLAEADIKDSPELQAQQRTIGQVHARIKIPIHLVMEGAIVLKQRLFETLRSRPDVASALETAQIADARIDRAILLMSQAYVQDTAAGARLDEAYRLFSLDQDIAVEKETQRAALMEWSQRTLFGLLRGEQGSMLDRLGASEFGFWVRHRAAFMFEQSPQFRALNDEIERVDRNLLPALERGSGADRQSLLAELQVAVDRIAFLLAELFGVLSSMEVGRDPLTRTLNRRFLPAILGREVTYASTHGTPLTVLLIDVDHFKAINDAHGHQAGDVVLRQVAQVITENVRANDFVFRYGGEEFLVVSAETGIAEAQAIAERIRTSVAAQLYEISGTIKLNATASIGIAGHNGHPDQSYLIKAADAALYRAKANGRNRIEIAPPAK